jgi:hypothetical protein
MQALKRFSLFLFQILVPALQGQNLVQNGSFEEGEFYPKKCDFENLLILEHEIYANCTNVYGVKRTKLEEWVKKDPCILFNWDWPYNNSDNLSWIKAPRGTTNYPISAASGIRYMHLAGNEVDKVNGNVRFYLAMGLMAMRMDTLNVGKRYKFSLKHTAGPENVPHVCEFEGLGVAFSKKHLYNRFSPEATPTWDLDLLETNGMSGRGILSEETRTFYYPEVVKKGSWRDFSFEFTSDSTYSWLTIGRLGNPAGQLSKECWSRSFSCFIDDVNLVLLDRQPLIEGPTEICAGDSLLLRNANGDTVYFEAEPIRRFPVQWLDAQGNLLDSSVNLRVKPIASTWYVARYAMESDTHWVVVHPRPDLRILSEEKGCGPAGRPHTLRGAVSSQRYHWTPPDTTAWRIQTFDTSRIRIRVSTAAGCVDSTSYLPQDSCGYLLGLYIPNALYTGSPHGNTGLEISHPAIESLQLSIYNRWGAKIADLQGINSVRWQPDSDIMQGVYAWRCTARYRDSRNAIQTDYLQGTVHVFR